jgi:hypothetical protein
MDEIARTIRRANRKERDRPLTATDAGRRLLGNAVAALAPHFADLNAAPKPPRGLGSIIKQLPPEKVALVALDALINAIVAGWDWNDESVEMKVAQEIGRDLRDELEIQRLLDPDTVDHTRVMNAQNRHAALWRYRTPDWPPSQLVRAGAWLIERASAADIFDVEYRQAGRNILQFPKIRDDHWVEVEKLREELALARPYYLPHDKPPPDWTAWRTEYGDKRMSATFVRDEHPDTVAAVTAAFADGSIKEHAEGRRASRRAGMASPARQPNTLGSFDDFTQLNEGSGVRSEAPTVAAILDHSLDGARQARLAEVGEGNAT